MAACFLPIKAKNHNSEMNYAETLDFLYKQLPMFQRMGSSAMKKDLTNIIALSNHLGNPIKN